MGIALENILIYDLALLVSAGYERTYSSYIKDIPASLRLMSVEELNRFDVIVFGGGDASVLLGEIIASISKRIYKPQKLSVSGVFLLSIIVFGCGETQKKVTESST